MVQTLLSGLQRGHAVVKQAVVDWAKPQSTLLLVLACIEDTGTGAENTWQEPRTRTFQTSHWQRVIGFMRCHSTNMMTGEDTLGPHSGLPCPLAAVEESAI